MWKNCKFNLQKFNLRIPNEGQVCVSSGRARGGTWWAGDTVLCLSFLHRSCVHSEYDFLEFKI